MTDQELQEQVDLGRQAEEFNRYVHEHPYFEGLLERIKLEFMQEMYGLDPSQKDEFSELMIKMHFIPDIMNAVYGDIYMASEALGKLNGVKEQGGIL